MMLLLSVIYEHRAFDLPCLCGQCATRLRFVGKDSVSWGDDICRAFISSGNRAVWMLTGRRDESFVDWQKRCELC